MALLAAGLMGQLKWLDSRLGRKWLGLRLGDGRLGLWLRWNGSARGSSGSGSARGLAHWSGKMARLTAWGWEARLTAQLGLARLKAQLGSGSAHGSAREWLGSRSGGSGSTYGSVGMARLMAQVKWLGSRLDLKRLSLRLGWKGAAHGCGEGARGLEV